MGAYSGIVSLISDACGFARSMKYPESSICVLGCNESELKDKFPLVYENLLSCSHNRDKRGVMEYGRDLVASWLFEDYIIHGLSECGLEIGKNGTDRNREILSSNNVSHTSDCTVRVNGKERCVELMCDYSGWWKRTGNVDLRDHKYEVMAQENSMLLGISFADKSYFLIGDMASEKAQYIPQHKPYGNKPAYRINVTENDLKPIDFNKISDEIRKFI